MTTSVSSEALQRALRPVDSAVDRLPDTRLAAVLALIFQDEGEHWIPLIRRAEGPDVHGGQLALPGGAYEPEDSSLAETARRETFEEIGIPPDSIQLLGRLPSSMVSVSRFQVVPFVGWAETRPAMKASDAEVAEIILLPLRLLLDPTGVREMPAPAGSRFASVFEYDVDGRRLWGATARIIAMLGTVIRGAMTNPGP